jgi:hypothetical protein
MIKGSLWIEGKNLHVIGEDGLEWYYTGDKVETVTDGVSGSVWIEENSLRYIDSEGAERAIGNSVMTAVPGKTGSLWVEGKFLSWVDELGRKRQGHSDAPHSDQAAQSVGHTDYSSYSNTYFPGSYSNEPPFSGYPHLDNFYGMEHSDYGSYSNVAHADAPHNDIPYNDFPKKA